MSSLSNLVRRQLYAADIEAARLVELAAMSGALPSEITLVWRIVRSRGGAWPFLS